MTMWLDQERFDTSCETLCTSLRWKQQFIGVDHDPTVPPSNDGPDGQLAEPGKCASTDRKCHGTGKCG